MFRKLICGILLAIFFILGLATQAQETAPVSVSESDELGQFLVDSTGLTLYIFTNDTANASNCTGECINNWAPLTVMSADITAPEGVAGTFGIIERADTGELQVTYNRQPLYYFNGDTASGETNGQGLGDVWFVARPQLLALGNSDELGSFLTDAAGNTLYIFTRDEEGVSNCSGDCLATWPPFTINHLDELYAGLDVVAQADLSTLERADTGDIQVVYQGQPLYYFANDTSAGDTNGQGVGDVWFVINPPALTISSTDEFGDILTGRDGTTVYQFANDTEGVSNCTDNCAAVWPPLTVNSELDLASIASDLVSAVTLIERADGSLQVAYDGQPLYNFAGDAEAGDTNGQGVGDVWSVVPVETSDQCRVSSNGTVNLRTGPGTNYAIAGNLTANENPVVTGQAIGTDNFVWWQLESGAWVRSDIVTAEGSCDSVPTVSAPSAPPTAVPVQPTAAPAQPTSAPPPPTAPPPSTTEEA